MIPLKQGQDRNNIRWPLFNQRGLTEPSGTFLMLLESRAKVHPSEFAGLDNFWDNSALAISEGLVANETSSLAAIDTITSNEGEYGVIISPASEEAETLGVDTGLWPEPHATQLMVNQHRIYRFLEGMVSEIVDSSSKVPGEEQDIAWKLQPPAGEPDSEEYEADLDRWIDFNRATIPYTPLNEPLLSVAIAICDRQVNVYERQLRGLKANPGLLFQSMFDVREHSDHLVGYFNGNMRHTWVCYARLQNLFYATRERGIGGELSLTGA